jgi:toxin ParE1/3/4
MTIVFTAGARADLDEVLAYTRAHYPNEVVGLETRIGEVIARIEQFPRNAKRVTVRSSVRVVPLIRYPFRIFYRVTKDDIEILHVYHVARNVQAAKLRS